MSRLRRIQAVTVSCGCVVLMGLRVALSAEPAGDGKLAFNNFCRTCHSAKKDDNRLGPSLQGIVGAKAGQAPGYANYSQSLKQSGITWNDSTLDRYIENPEAVVPNNNMKPYAGIADPALRKKIIEYLKMNRGDS